jgi:macrolide-specific efflux system membrane fusion protein
MNTKKVVGTIIAAAVVIGISGFLYISSNPKAKPDLNNTAMSPGMVLEFKVTREDMSSTVEVKGKSSYLKETFIFAPFSGNILEWKVAEGTQVKKGDLLYSLDAAPLRSEIDQLQANLRKQSLEAELNSFRLAGDQVSAGSSGTGISEADARARYADAESRKIQDQLNAVNQETIKVQLKQKHAKAAQAEFLAPEDGIFLYEDSAKIPQSVEESVRIGKIVDLTKLQLVSTVGEFDVFQIKPGMPVIVSVDALKQTKLQGIVEKVSKFAKSGTDQGTGSAQFELTISLEAHEQLIAGLSLSGTIETEKKQGVLVVPTLAIQYEKEDTYVMLQTPQGVTKQMIEIGMETAEKTEVLKGLNEGDTVVLQ